LAATAQAVYGLVGVGGATAVLMLLSGWLYARFGPAGFWAMGALCTAAFPVICDSADASAPIPIPARELKPDRTLFVKSASVFKMALPQGARQ
jgi:hypothetical protein